MRCLAKAPPARYARGYDLADALIAFLRRPRRTPRRISRRFRRAPREACRQAHEVRARRLDRSHDPSVRHRARRRERAPPHSRSAHRRRRRRRMGRGRAESVLWRDGRHRARRAVPVSRRSSSAAIRGRSRTSELEMNRALRLQRLGEVGDQRGAARSRGQDASAFLCTKCGAWIQRKRAAIELHDRDRRERRRTARARRDRRPSIPCSRSSSAPIATSRSFAPCARRRRTRFCVSTPTPRGRPSTRSP